MFDIGFWELATLAVIGLIVLGPERLPVVARTLGRWVGQARHYVNALTTELENEVGAEDIRDDVRRAREQIESETREARSGAQSAMDSLNEPIEGRSEADSESEPTPAADSAQAAVPSEEASDEVRQDDSDRGHLNDATRASDGQRP